MCIYVHKKNIPIPRLSHNGFVATHALGHIICRRSTMITLQTDSYKQ